ncbi:helicase-related protein [Agromyces salentinus]|uniref:Helicase C-terminal domain-containing protein n=1 Tax=Agromyces salentinus TaxID=269421 RepID=A0ABN2MNI6_9MICO|nr:helicase-related protein [Agromyces salentinus]
MTTTDAVGADEPQEAPDGRDLIVDELRRAWLGPRNGDEELLQRSPVYAYLVGALYPVESGEVKAQPVVLDEEIDPDSEMPEHELGADAFDDGDATTEDADEDPGLNLAGAFGWAPQSMGMSFIHDGAITVTIDAGVYAPEDESTPARSADQLESQDSPDNVGTDADQHEAPDGPQHRRELWRRRQLSSSFEIPRTDAGKLSAFDDRATVAWRSRVVGGLRLTTIAISNAATANPGKAKSSPEDCLFQVRLQVDVAGGALHPYPTGNPVNASDEDLELELRYRDKATYAIGHGVAVDWQVGTAPTTAWTECIPTETVPAVRARVSSDAALELKWLADESRSASELASGLRGFLAGYGEWIVEQRASADAAPQRFVKTAGAIASRAQEALDRMSAGIDLLETGGNTLTAFRLANAAMREQMLQQGLVRAAPGRIGVPLASVADDAKEPRWHPFQLGFILLALESTVDPSHEDRELVDLIWFPTGGGKTEAYLGLAAIEMIRRRLDRGVSGGGTAVITRYTMRLLTAQQFQRAATLICALELMRKRDARMAGSPPFSIGLWLGNTTTPGSYEQAADIMNRIYKERSPGNPFQIRQCSWCGTDLMPTHKSTHKELYGIRATKYSFDVFCPHKDCPFHAKLPVQVVDQGIFDEPPTMLVATVDKFARLAWIENGQSLFGLGGSPFDPPSLVIQDELHLIAGPLGTIVGVYEAAIRGLIAWTGKPAKVVASTATTRAAGDQIRELMASKVAVFPPSGMNADDNYFSKPDPTRPGRMYVGIMPQAHTPSWAIGQLSSELLQAPIEVGLTGAELDAYWTLVVYHNSLRELGRTMTILRDDVRSVLERWRSQNPQKEIRELRRDGIDELNGNVSSDDLLKILDLLSKGPEQNDALDALATTNIMSVGIDVSRLGLMLVNGHPKSTSEYIQATSRVGRGKVPGLVVTMFRSGKPRDRSVFESFTAFHRAYYRFVEPGTVTPWSLQARRRALRSALVILMRHGGGLTANDRASRFEADSASTEKAVRLLSDHVGVADQREAAVVRDELDKAVADWENRIEAVSLNGNILKFQSRTPEERLLKQFTDPGAGWATMNSMRSVDRVVRVRADGER